MSVKKTQQNINLLNQDIDTVKDIEADKIKTTNVNILLNRVRLNKKRTLKKRIVFSVCLIGSISLLAAYFYFN
tara:strand:- start:73 stop:291 length:219 start_codon:yes stop_codon:yes gene_type:complete